MYSFRLVRMGNAALLLTSCKVIRVDTRTTNYKQSPTTVNIDRPAHIKTDKQCRTHTTSTARLPDD